MEGPGMRSLFNRALTQGAIFNVVEHHDVFFRVRIEYSSPISEGHYTDVTWLWLGDRFVQRRQLYK